MSLQRSSPIHPILTVDGYQKPVYAILITTFVLYPDRKAYLQILDEKENDAIYWKERMADYYKHYYDKYYNEYYEDLKETKYKKIFEEKMFALETKEKELTERMARREQELQIREDALKKKTEVG